MPRPLILVVEDEPLLRLHAVSLIEEAGYDTLEAGSADEAIAYLEDEPRIRAVFTDVDLPGRMDGLRLAAAIRDRWPPVELIVTSGHVKITDIEIPERSHFLSKPYDAGRLLDVLEGFHLR